MDNKKIIKCPHCKSKEVYRAGGGNMFTPANGQKDEERNLYIEAHYCNKCLGFWGIESE